MSAKNKVPEKKQSGGKNAPAPAASPFDELRRRMDLVFEDFTRGWPASASRGWPGSLFDFDLPAMKAGLGKDLAAARFDVAESDGALEVTAELPGMDEKDVELTIADGLLTVKGEKKAEKEEKKKDYHLSERRYGSIQRSFRLPEGVEADKAKASFDKGVLKITLPKKAPPAKAKATRIPIAKS